MDAETLYELVHEAVGAAIERHGGRPVRILKRLVGGRLLFEDRDGKEVRAIPVESLFKKVTAVRDRLRTVEQKINASGLPDETKAEIQDLLTKAYGSLTTFNFLFDEEGDKFRGSGA